MCRDETQPKSPHWYRFVIEGILFLTYVAFGMTWASAGSFLHKIMADLSIGLSHASFINTSVSLAKIFGPVAAGVISKKMGLRWAFMLASGLICIGVLTPMAPNFPLLLLARFGMGLGGALVVVYFTPIVMQWFEGRERTVVNGMNFVSISVGMMIGLGLTDYLLKSEGVSWRSVLTGYSLVSVALALTWLFFGKEKEGCETWRPENFERKGEGYVDALKDVNTWKLAGSYCGVLSVYLVLITYFPVYYKKYSGFPLDSIAQKAPAVVMFSGIPVIILGIILSHRCRLRLPLIRIAGAVFIPSLAGMYLLKNEYLVVLSAVGVGFGMFFWRPSFFTIPQELPGSTPVKAGYVMGIFWAFSYTVATFNTWLVGKITETAGGFLPGFIYITVISATMFVGSFIIPETGAKEEGIGKERQKMP